MIFRRPLLITLCPLIAVMAGMAAGRAEPAAPAAPTPAHSVPPVDAAGLPAVSPLGGGPGSTAPATTAETHPAVDSHPPATAAASPAPPLAEPGTTTGEPDGKLKPGAAAHAAEGGREEVIGLQTLGTSLTERGDWAAAEIAFRQILSSRRANNEDLASALIGLARVYRKHGELTKAAAIYERYLKDYPTDERVPDALLELGRTHRALGAYQLAFARFYSVINSTLKLSSQGFEHYQVLAKTAQFEIAETHFQQGNFAEANKFFSRLRLLDLAPADRARAHFKSAYALHLGGDLAGAVTALRAYLEQWPQDENVGEARYLLALSLRALDHKQEALEATLQLLRAEQASADPKRWSYWQRRTGNQLANQFFQDGDTLNALAIYQGLAALADDPAWRLPVTYQIALCYERMRLNDRAAAAYQSIVDNANPPPAAKAAGAEPAKPANAELTELARMAAWRLTQLNWHEQTEQQLSAIFTSGAGSAARNPPALTNQSPPLDTPASAKLPVTTAHDQPGNPATTPPGL